MLRPGNELVTLCSAGQHPTNWVTPVRAHLEHSYLRSLNGSCLSSSGSQLKWETLWEGPSLTNQSKGVPPTYHLSLHPFSIFFKVHVRILYYLVLFMYFLIYKPIFCFSLYPLKMNLLYIVGALLICENKWINGQWCLQVWKRGEWWQLVSPSCTPGDIISCRKLQLNAISAIRFSSG